MDNIRQRIACKAVIQYQSKILILREAATYVDGTNVGRYHFPGGRIEPGGPFMDGLARKIMEETGLQVTYGKPLFVGEWIPVIRGEKNHIVAVFFLCTAQTDQVKLSSEHDKYEWIDPKTYREYDLMTPDDKVIETLLDNNSANQ